MCQYDISIPEEYTEEVIKELGLVLGIEIDQNKLRIAMENNGGVFIANTENNRIIADCMHTGLLNSIVVICSLELCKLAHDVLLKWDTIARQEYHQELRFKLEDRSNSQESLLKRIEKTYTLYFS